MINQNDKLKALRANCKKNGYTYKKDDYSYLNGKASYRIVCRKTGITLQSLLSIDDSYAFMMQTGRASNKFN